MKKKVLFIVIAIVICLSVTFIVRSITSTNPPETLFPSEIEAINQYVDSIIAKLDSLYAKFEEGETYAKRIADERLAPYQMAIGHMAEIRKVVGEIEALPVLAKAESIQDLALNKLRSWQAGLDEVASKTADTVEWNDPSTFYLAYLDILIEIPELKQDLRAWNS